MKTTFHDFSEPLFSFRRVYEFTPPTDNMHFHAHYELDVILSGHISVRSTGVEIPCDKPCILLYKPYTFHTNNRTDDTRYELFVFHFNNEIAAQLPKALVSVDELFKPNVSLLPLDDEMLREVLALLGAYSSAPEREKQRRLLLACLLEFTERNYAGAINDRCFVRDGRLGYIRDVASMLGDRFSERFTSDSIAAEYHISRQKLDNDFREVMGITLRQYILDIRIANAVRLLSLGKRVTDVAYDCGFSTESHFIHVFKDRMGVSPNQYAKSTSAARDNDDNPYDKSPWLEV